MGLGCMGMSESYGAADWDGGLATIDRALELGITFLDTADAYGTGHNEVLVGRAIHGRRDQVQLATKFGIDRSAGDRARRIRGARLQVLPQLPLVRPGTAPGSVRLPPSREGTSRRRRAPDRPRRRPASNAAEAMMRRRRLGCSGP